MNRFDMAIAVEAARFAIDRSKPAPKRPATVQTVSAKTATILVDGAKTAVPVSDLVGVAIGNRVMVEFQPSGAAYITHKI